MPRRPARPSCERYRRALELLDAAGGDPLRALPARRRPRAGSRSPPPRRPTRCCRCWRPAEGLRLQLDAGIRSHRRRFGWDGGFWLPECAYAPGLEWRLAEHGVRWFCVDQSAHERAARRAGAGRDRGRAGGAADRLGGDQLALVARRLPLRPRPRPVRRQVAARDPDLEGRRRRLRPGRGRRGGAPRRPREFLAAVADAAARLSPRERGRRGLLVFAIDTELLGHWWSEGPIWLEEVLEGAEAAGVRLLTVPQALAEHEPVERPLARLDLGRGQGPAHLGLAAVADLAWARAAAGAAPAAGALAAGLPRRAPPTRAARELLAVQASDWAFLDGSGAGRRLRLPARHRARRGGARGHRLTRSGTDPRMRSLAPDLSLAPLLEP